MSKLVLTLKSPTQMWNADKVAYIWGRLETVIFDVLPYSEAILKNVEIGANAENVPLSGEELIF